MIPFKNTYSKLPERFYSKTKPAAAPQPDLIKVNAELAEELGIDAKCLESANGLAVLSGNTVAEGSEPVSQAYAGHQFGGWVSQLGDGRAVLLGEVENEKGQLRDIQLKGSGRTAYSRGGDGKAALGPVIREYLMSEAMYALGVPTTRALAAVSTGEKVVREELLEGGVLTRVAASHLRVGTFQYFAARKDDEALLILVNYALDRHFPEKKDSANKALTLLGEVISVQAELVAKWMTLGFIHGVMNTDNTTISGETIDYGPCAFMDDFHPNCVFSAIDRNSRYAWGNQASIIHWNLTRLAETLLPLIDPDKDKAVELAGEVLDGFSDEFRELYHNEYSKKFGISAKVPVEFIQDSLAMMAEQEVDYTLFFRCLTKVVAGESTDQLESLFNDAGVCKQWLGDWRAYHSSDMLETMQSVNPVLVPRNHQVERAIQDAYKGDYTLFHRLCEAWKTPYLEQAVNADLELAPLPEERVLQTFCGT